LVPDDARQGFYDFLASQVPLGRLGEPAEIGKAVVFLASDSASFINGIDLYVDGGTAQV
jgi:NAD(P)-dependent dehydrogenase (short-subunit alcohol dehydrogenase family)